MIPPEMALSSLVGLLKNILCIAVSLAHTLKNAQKIFDERVEVRRLRGEMAKHPI